MGWIGLTWTCTTSLCNWNEIIMKHRKPVTESCQIPKDNIETRIISANLGPLLLYTVMYKPIVLGDGCTGKNGLTVMEWWIWCQKFSKRTDFFWGIEHEINLINNEHKMSFCVKEYYRRGLKKWPNTSANEYCTHIQ